MNNKDNTTPHHSAVYDERVRQTVPFFREFHTETIDLVKTVKPNVKVWLDTGCGTGTLAARAMQHFPKTCFLLADPSEGMLEQAQIDFSGLPGSRVEFLGAVGTGDIKPAGTTKPDVISAIQCHHYMKEAKRMEAVQNCFNLLDGNGLFITFENVYPNSETGIEIGLKRWMAFQRSAGRDAAVVKEHGKRFNTAYFPISPAAHIKMMKQCGFQTVELFWFSHMQAGFYAIK
ncbi:MAG: class I SAM-dependent methyltransferase [bacterium]|nr:class I SAM-dependent methyltransferase [bacterium]